MAYTACHEDELEKCAKRELFKDRKDSPSASYLISARLPDSS